LANCIFKAFKIYVSPILRESYVNESQQPTPVVQPEAPVVEEEEPAPQPKQPVKQVQQTQTPAKSAQQPAKAETKVPVQQTPAVTKPASSGKEYEFRVQFMISDKQLRQDNEKFKGLKDIKSYEVSTGNNKRQFVYTTGSFASYKDARDWQQKVVVKNPGCFVVVFKDNKRVTGDEEATAKKVQK